MLHCPSDHLGSSHYIISVLLPEDIEYFMKDSDSGGRGAPAREIYSDWDSGVGGTSHMHIIKWHLSCSLGT